MFGCVVGCFDLCVFKLDGLTGFKLQESHVNSDCMLGYQSWPARIVNLKIPASNLITEVSDSFFFGCRGGSKQQRELLDFFSIRLIGPVPVTVLILYVGVMPGDGRQNAETRVDNGATFTGFPRHVAPAAQRLLGSRDT